MAQRIVDVVFGCCLGNRHGRRAGNGEDEAGPSDLSRASQSNERTPLLADQRAAAGKDGSQGQDGSAAAAGDQSGRGNNASGSGVDKPKSPKRRTVDAEHLRAISEQAQTAFFDVESSQLLPSSTSLAQRQASMGASQRLNRRDEVLSASRTAAAGQRGGKTDVSSQSAAIRKNKELMAASDRAERLYTAALVAEASAAADDNGARVRVKDKTPDTEVPGRNAKQMAAPISLVRPARLSVHDLKAYARRGHGKSTLQGSNTASAADVTQAGERGAEGDRASTTTVNGSRSNMHSLRTLQLVRADSGDAIPGDFDEELDASAHLAVSGHPQSTSSSSSPAARSHEDTDDTDEEWGRRGRTRSKRNLIWLDTTRQASTQPAVSQETGGHVASAEPVEGQAQRGDAEDKDEPLYALRLDGGEVDSQNTAVGDAGDHRQKLREHISAAITEPLAEIWETNGGHAPGVRGAGAASAHMNAPSVSERS